jgi:ornithine cyclodeaminase/alanine dehydrogenase-like protein (mu-crystallin family)
MTLLLQEADVRALLTMPDTIEAVEQAFRRVADGKALMHPRRRVHFSDSAFLHYMAAGDNEAGWLGMKIYTSVRGALRFMVPLYRARTGELAALIEADFLGQMRTGAASGVATKFMARENSATAGIVGTGLQARTQLQGVCCVRKIERIRCFGRNPERRARFAQEMTQELGVPVEAMESAEAAVREADIVISATSSSTPVIQGRWIAPGAHINAIGGNFPQKRELDEEAVSRAGVIVADSREQSRMESGDLIQVLGEEERRWAAVHELAEIVSFRVPGRTDNRQITLFKSNGVAIEDVAAAALAYERALERQLGTRIPLWEHCG